MFDSTSRLCVGGVVTLASGNTTPAHNSKKNKWVAQWLPLCLLPETAYAGSFVVCHPTVILPHLQETSTHPRNIDSTCVGRSPATSKLLHTNNEYVLYIFESFITNMLCLRQHNAVTWDIESTIMTLFLAAALPGCVQAESWNLHRITRHPHTTLKECEIDEKEE